MNNTSDEYMKVMVIFKILFCFVLFNCCIFLVLLYNVLYFYIKSKFYDDFKELRIIFMGYVLYLLCYSLQVILTLAFV